MTLKVQWTTGNIGRRLLHAILGRPEMTLVGAHPGMTNLVGMVLSGSCERVDEIRITESVDCSTYESMDTQFASLPFSRERACLYAKPRADSSCRCNVCGGV
jgi:hypothetical protein